MNVSHILETALYVDDLKIAKTFYQNVLGLDCFSAVDGRHAFFRLGRSVLLIFQPDATAKKTGHVPTHGASGPGHCAFAVSETSLADWREHLQSHNVPIETEITWPNGAQSIYFRDPAGNSLELATPRIWNLSEDAVFGAN